MTYDCLVNLDLIASIGAMMEEHPVEGDIPKMTGSIMLALAESKDEVIEALQKDVYYQSGVWDWEKVQIHPVSTISGDVSWLLTSDSLNQSFGSLFDLHLP